MQSSQDDGDGDALGERLALPDAEGDSDALGERLALPDALLDADGDSDALPDALPDADGDRLDEGTIVSPPSPLRAFSPLFPAM